MAVRSRNDGGPLGPFFLPPAPVAEPPPPDTDISVAGMSQADKGAVWRHIKATDPARAAFLTDPVVQRPIAAGAVPVFPRELVRTALINARQKVPA